MRILSTAYITLIRYLRNKLVLMFFILGPIAFVLIMQGADYKIEFKNREKVGYCFDIGNKVSEGVLELLNTNKIKEKIEIKEYKTLSSALEDMEKGDLETFIYSEGKEEIKIYNTTSFSSVNLIVDSYLTEVKKQYLNIRNENVKKSEVETMRIKTEGKIPNANIRILIAVTITLLFYVSILTAYSIIKNYRNNTYIRIRCSSAKAIENYLGISIGNILFMFIVLSIVIIMGKLVIGIEFNIGILKLILIALMFFLFASNLGAITTYISRNIYVDALMLFSINFLFVFPVMTEAFNPGGNSVPNIIKMHSPHYYCYNGMLGSLYTNVNGANSGLLIVGGVAVITTIVVMLLERRKAYEYI
ncbi:ABC-2 type transporter [Clostridium cavendishii DSM 21758]|uniref:ABC-2 type transporter n=1 Tax=Clostridium cavendishii DSM 21758 TaxID=1121302 RepID=A0A1M6TXP4_9CLOT|nr:ABC transporter permease [Clostridium cavendishii]SHK61654.1 ABC-2 type transporter [Clostridium cavendishii DSM 21758]